MRALLPFTVHRSLVQTQRGEPVVPNLQGARCHRMSATDVGTRLDGARAHTGEGKSPVVQYGRLLAARHIDMARDANRIDRERDPLLPVR